MKNLEKIIEEAVNEAFKVDCLDVSHLEDKKENIFTESYVVEIGKFNLQTELLSKKSKKAHLELFENYTNTLNKISSKLDGVDKSTANLNSSSFRSLKIDEVYNHNASFLHGMFFENISDLNSTITMDSLSYMRLSRDFGTFDAWQEDFVACCLSARNGWAITYFDLHMKKYVNTIVDLHSQNVMTGMLPIVVVDCWEHSYYKDYLSDRKTYIFAMMKELNWSVIESRIEKADEISKILWEFIMTFSNKINSMLVENKKYDLTLLVEEENLFDMPEKDESDDSTKKDSSNDNSETSKDTPADNDDELESSEDDSNEDDSNAIDYGQIETMNKKIEKIGKILDKGRNNYPNVENFIASNLRTESKNYSKQSIERFLLFENEDVLKDTEENIDALDRILQKGSDLISTFAERGDDIDIELYVSAAINAYKNFDSLFSKEDIVKQATINVLLLNSGENADRVINQFEELYHEELHKQFGIEREEHALIVNKSNVAAGAVRQG